MAIRIAVVGMGCRGRDWVREVKAAAPAFELVACVDVDSDVLKTVSGVSAAQCFTRLEEALDSSGCEAVIVATPAETHAAACAAALERKIAVLQQRLPELFKRVDALEAQLVDAKNVTIRRRQWLGMQ